MPIPPTPKIVWGDAWEHTWTFSGPVDNPQPKSNPVGAIAESDSGLRDWWETRDDEELRIEVRFIPMLSQVTPMGFTVTGYADADGVREALRWMRKNRFRFYPNKDIATYHTCYLLEMPEVNREEGGTHYRCPLNMRDVDQTVFNEY